MSISTDVRYESTTTDLLFAARSGDRSAWEQIVTAMHDSCDRSPRSSGSRNRTPRTSRRTPGYGFSRTGERSAIPRSSVPGSRPPRAARRPRSSAGPVRRWPGSRRATGWRPGIPPPKTSWSPPRPPPRSGRPPASSTIGSGSSWTRCSTSRRHQLRRGVAANGAADGKHRSDPDPDAQATAPVTGRHGTRRMIAAPRLGVSLLPRAATAGSPRRTSSPRRVMRSPG